MINIHQTEVDHKMNGGNIFHEPYKTPYFYHLLNNVSAKSFIGYSITIVIPLFTDVHIQASQV